MGRGEWIIGRASFEFVISARPFFIKFSFFRNIKFPRDIIVFPSMYGLGCPRSRRKFGERKFDL